MIYSDFVSIHQRNRICVSTIANAYYNAEAPAFRGEKQRRGSGMNGKNQFGKQRLPRRALLAMALAAINFGASAQHLEADHREFEATLYAPYTAGAQGSRSFTLDFSYPFVESAQDIVWRLELLDSRGSTVQRWQGVERLIGAPRKVNIDWAGRSADPSLADGIYTVRMLATAKPATAAKVSDTSKEAVDALLASAEETEEQKWEIMVGELPAAEMPSAATMAAPLPKASARSCNAWPRRPKPPSWPAPPMAAASMAATVLARLHRLLRQPAQPDQPQRRRRQPGHLHRRPESPVRHGRRPDPGLHLCDEQGPRLPDGLRAQPHVRRFGQHQWQRQRRQRARAVPVRPEQRRPASMRPTPTSSACTAWNGA